MQLNLTLVGQGLTFGVFIWFTMRYVWPPLLGAIDQREKHISEGIAAGEEGRKQLAQTKEQVQTCLQEATRKASEIITRAEQQSQIILETAKQEAYKQTQQQLEQAKQQIMHQRLAVQAELARELSHLLTQGMERIFIEKGASNEVQYTWIDKAIREIL